MAVVSGFEEIAAISESYARLANRVVSDLLRQRRQNARLADARFA